MNKIPFKISSQEKLSIFKVEFVLLYAIVFFVPSLVTCRLN